VSVIVGFVSGSIGVCVVVLVVTWCVWIVDHHSEVLYRLVVVVGIELKNGKSLFRFRVRDFDV
jgi:small neutral amino acid transporter SnatA (MarC family)